MRIDYSRKIPSYTIEYTRADGVKYCQGRMTLEMAEMNVRLCREVGLTCEVKPY